MNNNTLNLPKPERITGSEALGPLPYVFVGDEAFPLVENLLRPYPGRKGNLPHDEKVFNYRLSRARRIVENAFGILANRWRIYHRKIFLSSKTATKVVLATCVLHNFLQTHSTPFPISGVDDDSPSNLENLPYVGYKPGKEAKEIRDKFKTYFSTTGRVTWQDDKVQKGTY
jgi:hypothetical protein